MMFCNSLTLHDMHSLTHHCMSTDTMPTPINYIHVTHYSFLFFIYYQGDCGAHRRLDGKEGTEIWFSIPLIATEIDRDQFVVDETDRINPVTNRMTLMNTKKLKFDKHFSGPQTRTKLKSSQKVLFFSFVVVLILRNERMLPFVGLSHPHSRLFTTFSPNSPFLTLSLLVTHSIHDRTIL